MVVGPRTLLLLFFSLPTLPGTSSIVPCFHESCSPWLDVTGQPIHAHGGGLLQADGQWFWYGESEKRTAAGVNSGFSYSVGVNCYSAPSITGPWTFHGLMVSQTDLDERLAWPPKDKRQGPWIIERPKVL